MQTYLRLLDDSDTLPAAICFYPDGVKVVVEVKGDHLIICNTCLNHYDLANKIQAGMGIIDGMIDIIEAQWRADKVITI